VVKTALVIGAGITGVSTAEWLRRDGVQVTLVDRVDPGDPAQTSYGNAGILARCAVVPVSVPGLLAKAPGMLLDPHSPLFMRWRYLPRLLPWLVPFLRNGRTNRVREIAAALAYLTDDSVDQHLALARGTAAEKYIRTSEYSYLYRNRQDFNADTFGMGLRHAHGFHWTEHEGKSVRDMDPNLSADYGFAATFKDHGWITSPGQHVAALAAHFLQNGGRFRRGDVVDIDSSGVTLRGGETLCADKIVLAAGVWSKSLAAKLGCKIALESERGYHLVLKNPSHSLPTPYMIADRKFVTTPMDDGIRLAGLVELGGIDAPPSKRPVEVLRQGIRKVYPHLTWEAEDKWMGHRPSTPDSLPVIGPAPGSPNVIFAFGSQHIGLTIGPRLGRMVADLVMDRPANVDLSPYASDRFSNNKGKIPKH